MKLETLLSQRNQNIKPSFIREILKASTNPQMISFAGGLPDAYLFPIDHLKEASSLACDLMGRKAFQYSTTDGIPELKEWIIHRYRRKYGMEIHPDELIITTGSQQGMDLISKAFIDQGNKILVENPGYLGAIQSFKSYGANIIGFDLNEDGPNLDMLENTLKFNPDLKFVYAVPNFQNPTGITYSKEKRKAIGQLLNRYNKLLIEDDPYGELNFSGMDTSPIKKNIGDRGILLGTFSKSLAPGLRIGWVIANKKIIQTLTKIKQSTDLHSSTFDQCLIYQYLSKYDYDEHINHLIQNYKRKHNTMIEAINLYLWTKVSYKIPNGGMFLWLQLPSDIDINDLLYKCMSRGVMFVPGNTFMLGKSRENYIRLNFTNSTDEEICRGIELIAECLYDL